MSVIRVGWSGRSFDYTEEEVQTVVNVMQNADPYTQGPHLEEFEAKFNRFTGSKSSFAVANCTNALDLAATMCQLTESDEVIIPAHTFCASAIPFGRTGAKIVWADICPETRVICPDSVASLITKNTKVIVVVHLYGLMSDMDSILELARQNDCIVVEDCAQSIGAEMNGKKAGSLGHFGCFSFHGQKSITTLGEGGMLTVNDERFIPLVRGLRHNGCRAYEGERTDYWKPAMSNVDLDIDGVWPYNFCLGEAQCALGAKILDRVDEMNDFRIKRAHYFINELKDFPQLSFQKTPTGFKHVYHLLHARYDGQPGNSRDDLIRLLHDKYGIKCVVQYYPLYRYPLFQKLGYGDANCPETDRFFDNMISFPFHISMPEQEFSYLIESVKSACRELSQSNN